MNLSKAFAVLLYLIPGFSGWAQQAVFTDIAGSNPTLFTAREAKGVAIADFDNDGDDDIFISGNPCKLFRNEGSFSFTEVSLSAGISIVGRLAIWFDSDDDGWLDLLVSGYNQLLLYRNNKNGTFTEVQLSGFFGTRMQVGLACGDLNNDGYLDVYANNFKLDNQLFLNYGSHQFRNRIGGSGSEVNDKSMGVIMLDVDDDNDLDLYLTFDGYRPNRLFVNEGSGQFSEQAAPHGLAIQTQGMGVDKADFNKDGKYDFYVTNLFENSLLISNPAGGYEERAAFSGVDDFGMGWGVVCLDYNNDGLTDIYINNEYGFSPHPNKFYKNNGDGTFSNIAAGTSLENKRAGFGCASADFDSDGRVDLVVVNFGNEPVRIFKNQEPVVNQWLQITLAGTASNKFGVGARVYAYADGAMQMQDVTAGSGWYSQNSSRLHFGLGSSTMVDSLLIRWPDGSIDGYFNVDSNNRYLCIQNESIQHFSKESLQNVLNRSSRLTPYSEIPADPQISPANHSIAYVWSEALLDAIRNDLARPTVHARNLFHVSAAMYDSWAVFESFMPTFLLGKTLGRFNFPFEGINSPPDKSKAQHEAISYAAYRIIKHRFANSPGAGVTLGRLAKLFQTLGYDESLISTDYQSGKPYALGNYVAAKIIDFGYQDGSNEQDDYRNLYYKPFNSPLRPELPGIDIRNPNRWQPLKLRTFIDQNGNEIGDTPPFLSAEWGRVTPFALTDNELSIKYRDGNEYWLYHDPGKPPHLDTLKSTALSEQYKNSFLLVSVWSSHLDPSDGVMIDISPASLGNIQEYPESFAKHLDYYRFKEGGDFGRGRTVNPTTGAPYLPQMVPRGDYARVLAEFWADGPNSETPPGHWFTLLNYVNYHPLFKRRFKGDGELLNELEWDVKSYLALSGALHDAAVATWGIKGYYDYVRPVSAIRYMASKGQSSDKSSPSYHPAGIPLLEGYCELVKVTDPLAGSNGEHIGKIKLKAWRGPDYINNPATDMAGVDWVLAENWWPYQRPTFVTPPFAGYTSGHSTFSSAAAEVLTLITGDPFFPGGMGEFHAKKNEYLVFEEGPSVDVKLQWATYKDAADQCSLSRIWGGIHPPIDDFPGRTIGKQIGSKAFDLANQVFAGQFNPQPASEITVEVYPVPASRNDLLTISHSEGIRDLEILSYAGNTTFGAIIVNKSVKTWKLDVGKYSPGIYVIKILGNSSVHVRKIILY